MSKIRVAQTLARDARQKRTIYTRGFQITNTQTTAAPRKEVNGAVFFDLACAPVFFGVLGLKTLADRR